MNCKYCDSEQAPIYLFPGRCCEDCRDNLLTAFIHATGIVNVVIDHEGVMVFWDEVERRIEVLA